MKKLLIITSLLFLCACTNKSESEMLSIIEVDNSSCTVEKEVDTHSGFLGDGEYFARMVCTKITVADLSSHWKEMPLNEELNEALLLENCDSESCKDFYERYDVKENINGYYIFKDRHSEKENEYDPTPINERSSYNYTVGIYDVDTNKIYYFEKDS